ncbi:hypothetical protein CSUI_009526, partial [Cystoisospora suis]
MIFILCILPCWCCWSLHASLPLPCSQPSIHQGIHQ